MNKFCLGREPTEDEEFTVGAGVDVTEVEFSSPVLENGGHGESVLFTIHSVYTYFFFRNKGFWIFTQNYAQP